MASYLGGIFRNRVNKFYAKNIMLGAFSGARNIALTTATNYPFAVFAKWATANSGGSFGATMRAAWFRTRVDANCHIGTSANWGHSCVGSQSTVKAYGHASETKIFAWHFAGIWAQLETDGVATVTFEDGCVAAAVYANAGLTASSSGNTNIESGAFACGVAINSNSAANVTETGTGKYVGLYIYHDNTACKDFTHGIYIDDSCVTTGITLNAMTTGISIAGATANGISITGASSTAQISLAHTMAAYNDQCILVVSSSAATDGSSQAPIKSSHTMSGAGATGGRAEFNCTFQPGSSGAAGAWTNALKGNFTFGSNSTGGTGLHTAITAEMSVPNCTVSGGEFACLDMQMGIPASHIPQAKGLSFFTMNSYTTPTVMDDSGTLFALYGVSGGDNKMFDDSVGMNNGQVEATLRIRILNDYWYIPLWDDPDGAA